MDNIRYDSLSEAVLIAITRCKQWEFALSSEEFYDAQSLQAMASISDEENPCDEDSFYLVSPAGAIGFSEDGEAIEWLFIPVNHNEDLPLEVEITANFCAQCGGGISPGARFCGSCGRRI